MRVPTKVAIFFAATIAASSAGVAIGHGPADAHTSGAAFTNAHCLDQGGWGANLTVTATNPELNPVATISTVSTPYDRAIPAGGYTTMMTAENGQPTITVGIKLKWSDGFAQNLGSFTANRPDGCTPPTTATPPTTTCDRANPPRDDCDVVATTAPTFAPPTTIVPLEPTTAAPTVDSTPQITQASTPATVHRVVPSTPATALPVTGAGNDILVIGGIALMVTGLLAMAFVTRRRGVS